MAFHMVVVVGEICIDPLEGEAMKNDDLLPEIAVLDLGLFMHEAMREAEQAGLAGELPIGAVLVIDGEIVARGRARHRASRSQLMHAEMHALLNGGTPLWERYESAVLFTTMEPCPMCLGAVVMADVPHIVFGSHDAVVDSRLMVETVPYVRRHIRTYHGGVLEDQIRELIARFDPGCLRYVTTREEGKTL
jgi:tRNA(adenine34) deaminase